MIFPDSPDIGKIYLQSNTYFKWDGEKWTSLSQETFWNIGATGEAGSDFSQLDISILPRLS